MNPQFLLTALEQHAQSIASLTRGLTTEQARWKPTPEDWSVLEVINHLYDEEREDFRARLEILLLNPGAPWSPIHPGAWVTEREYNSRDFETSVNAFLAERNKSLTWLASLDALNWESSATSPWGGEISAGTMFASWVAHDVLHLRQLVELHYALVKENAQPNEVGYAGDW